MAAAPSLARADDDRAQRLYRQHRTAIFAFCLSRLGDREDAEDATQTTFLNAFRSLQRGVDPALESAWLFKIANQVVSNRRRAASRRRRIETPDDLARHEETVALGGVERDALIGLSDALAALPAAQRIAFLLREWKGLSYDEIAAELDVSHAAVETLLFRARRALAAELARLQIRRSPRAASIYRTTIKRAILGR